MIQRLSAGSTIGIVGGGQLGRMLAMAAARLGYRTIVLEPATPCPAAQLCNQHIVAAYDDAAALAELARQCDVITYEFENVPVEAVSQLSGKCPVLPPPLSLKVAQDRLEEKKFLNKAGIETAKYAAIGSDSDLAAALVKFGGNGVLKTRRLGYDGKGQRVFRGAKSADTEGAVSALGDVPLILEILVPFTLEISVIAARGSDGAIAAYDPAENVHRDGILRTSAVPAAISGAVAKKAASMAEKLLNALNYTGVLGLELFVMEDGRLLANEFAPRVHNSGHWTEAACAVSQFEQHIRAIAGLPLGCPARHSDCVMKNLIGDEICAVPQLLGEANTFVHVYGKDDIRPGRKMGHVTHLTEKRSDN